MSVDTKLYISQRWEISDIKDILERTQQTKVKIHSHHDIAPGYFTFHMDDIKRMIHVHTYVQLPTGSVIQLDMHSDEQGKSILRSIAKCLGGLFMDNDVDDKIEVIDGNMSDNDALPYFIKYAVIHDGIEPHDIKGFIASMSKWYKDIKQSGGEPPILAQLQQFITENEVS